jgi:hypothetical protein
MRLTHPWWWRQYVPLKRRSTIILHGSTSQKIMRLTHPWWWRQYVPLKRRSTIILHGSTSQKTILNIKVEMSTFTLWKQIHCCKVNYCNELGRQSKFLLVRLYVQKMFISCLPCCWPQQTGGHMSGRIFTIALTCLSEEPKAESVCFL